MRNCTCETSITRGSHACLLGPALACLLALLPACGKAPPDSRGTAVPVAGQPHRISELTLPALVRHVTGALTTTLFIHSTFPSATESVDAIAVLRSEDAGATWTEVGRIPSQVTYGVWGHDLAAGDGERLYATWVAAIRPADSPQPYKAVMFARSDDAGRSWISPIQVNGGTLGQRRQPVIAVSGDDVHIAWLDSERPGVTPARQGICEDVHLVWSADGGTTWSNDACLETELERKVGTSGAPALLVGADGSVYCAYFAIRQHDRRVGGYCLARSSDRGRTFSTRLHNAGALGDLTLAVAEGKLYLAVVHIIAIREISMQAPQTRQEILLYVSENGGGDWTKPVTIDDDDQDRHKGNIRIVSLGSERLVASWHDERGGVYGAASVDGGRSWGRNIRLAGPSSVGITPMDLVADPSAGVFCALVSDVRKGGGDATYLLTGGIQTEGEPPATK
jgi:hypothetical protein